MIHPIDDVARRLDVLQIDATAFARKIESMLNITTRARSHRQSLVIDPLADGSPNEVIAELRRVAQAYRDSGAELQAAWQDDTAGKVWTVLADGLDRTADKAETFWSNVK